MRRGLWRGLDHSRRSRDFYTCCTTILSSSCNQRLLLLFVPTDAKLLCFSPLCFLFIQYEWYVVSVEWSQPPRTADAHHRFVSCPAMEATTFRSCARGSIFGCSTWRQTSKTSNSDARSSVHSCAAVLGPTPKAHGGSSSSRKPRDKPTTTL